MSASKDEYDKKEAERRFKQTLRGALVTPHRPHQTETLPKKSEQRQKRAKKRR